MSSTSAPAASRASAVAAPPDIDTRAIGSVLRTGATSRTVELAIGTKVTAGAFTRAKLVAPVGEAQTGEPYVLDLELEQGSLSVESGYVDRMDWPSAVQVSVARAGQFACAIDFEGACAFDVEVAADGAGRVRATSGAAFRYLGRAETLSFFGAMEIPAGAVIELYPDPRRPSGTPHFASASPFFQDALRAWDLDRDDAALGIVLREARRQDSLTLYFLGVESPVARERVAFRLEQLVPGRQYADEDWKMHDYRTKLHQTWSAAR